MKERTVQGLAKKVKVLNTRLTPKAFEALKALGKRYPREISLTQIASQAVLEKLDREINFN